MFDVCVIGGGPAGIFSTYYCASRGLHTLLLEGNEQLGGRLHYFLDMPIYDLPGQYGITAEDYLHNLEEQLHKSTATVQFNKPVNQIKESEQAFEIRTPNDIYCAKTVINATGTGFMRPKKLACSNFTATALQNICYSLPAHFKVASKIAVIGHTPMAIDWAIQLAKKQMDVLLIEFEPIQLQSILTEALKDLQVPILTLSDVNVDYLGGAFFINNEPFSHVFCHIGTSKESIILPSRIVQKDNGYTSLPGYFVAGDARFEQGKLKLIHGATHDAMQASNAAYLHCYPNETYQPIVSTHHPVFKAWNK